MVVLWGFLMVAKKVGQLENRLGNSRVVDLAEVLVSVMVVPMVGQKVAQLDLMKAPYWGNYWVLLKAPSLVAL